MDEERVVPVEVAELAAGCRRFVQESVGVALDGTQDTLPLLDHYLQQVPPSAPEAVRRLIAASAGAYFGEVVAHHLPGARWHLVGSEHTAWRIEFAPCFLAFHPIAMAREAIEGRELEGLFGSLHVRPQDREPLHEALDRLGGVREGDYYRLAVRFEVVQLAYEVLGARRNEGGSKRREPLGPEAYAHLDQEPEAPPS